MGKVYRGPQPEWFKLDNYKNSTTREMKCWIYNIEKRINILKEIYSFNDSFHVLIRKVANTYVNNIELSSHKKKRKTNKFDYHNFRWQSLMSQVQYCRKEGFILDTSQIEFTVSLNRVINPLSAGKIEKMDECSY